MSVVQSTLLTCVINIKMISRVDAMISCSHFIIFLRARAFLRIKVFDIEVFDVKNSIYRDIQHLNF